MKSKKVYSKPTKIEFYTKDGEKKVFKATETFTKPLKVEFYAKPMKSKKERTLRVVEEKNRRNRKRLEDIKPFVKSAKDNLLKASKILDQIN